PTTTTPDTDLSTPPANQTRPTDTNPGIFLPPPDQIRSIEELQKLVEENPNNAALKAELALAYLQAGQLEDARRIVQSEFRGARLPIAYISAAERLMETENMLLAIAVLQEGYMRFPNDTRIQTLLMTSLLITQQPPRTISDFLNLLETNSEQIDPAVPAMGEAYLALEEDNPEEALQLLDTALQSATTSRAELLYMTGLVYKIQDQSDLATDAFRAALQHNPAPWLEERIMTELEN
ncbi:MAG: hypothetical protein D6706_13110, partial [Chloroflexi bacterium]